MLNKRTLTLALVVVLAFALTVGCMVNKHTIGNGGTQETKNNATQWYLFWGLMPLGQGADGGTMHGGASDFTIKSYFGFLDWLVTWLTAGILSSRSVMVTF